MAPLPTVPLHPTCTNPLQSIFRGPYILNSATGDDTGNEEEENEKPEEKQEEEPAEEKKKKNSAESRIEALVDDRNKEREAREAAEAKLKEYEDAKKADDEQQLKEDGKLKELLEAKESELSETTASKETLQQKVDAYEAIATEQITSALESIDDEDRRKDAESLLDGRDLSEQFKLIPTILKLAGKEANNSFGTSTPSSSTSPGKEDIEQKKARYQELLEKENLSPKEQNEKNNLMFDLSKEYNKSDGNT